MKQSRDIIFLNKCLALAKNGSGLVSPNPMVGAVVVKGNHIAGYGWHRAFGLPHAEVEAIKMAGAGARNSTLYVNLEPCCHYGKTPPCTDLIINSGVKKVVFCTLDPNPEVNGKSVEILKNNGVEVRYGLLESEARRLNAFYFTFVEKKRPFISLKWAMSVDGKIADASGMSKWITTCQAREFQKQLRFEYDAILTGSGTILKDNPVLDFNVPGQIKKRLAKRKRFYKIILDSTLKIAPDANVFSNANANVVIFVANGVVESKKKFPENVEIVEVERESNGLLDIRAVIFHLYSKGIGKLFVQGGTKILTSFYNYGLFDNIYLFVGGKIIGGPAIYPPFEGKIIPLESQSEIHLEEVIRIKNDVLMVFRNVRRDN
ncbi:MAG: bifunctional diaminohydroxyphosphoribosylaminopyrimidine deaminase/5-amino-6-(5-phosphoribosylamino)uracil reductase RibD [Candidatus Omnitrophica bacterium]|nr:bifunctional diaminohydroxyphosphoribosylaminopyrimidine deaminase/5-amino-6-(5-phosphoribosylamino)uracil reductase RibD [Candidatus Omnitrophota bacterium]MCM8827710.1 bifunctional diaminohydroxyphosphoribosylaminopyrimidine deaminase/5-amino-6-(5-phosphoribosylamino)uracil reductase RibD [Candidatus Omnitrophota bacterium]